MMSIFFRSVERTLVTLTTFTALFLLSGCENNMVIVNDVNERDANEIVVFLASKGVAAEKSPYTSAAIGGSDTTPKWSIAVPPSQATEAMAILNQNGLPRQQGTNLLDLFAKSGLMSSEKEETIRYQAGLAQQIANMIRKIDGVIDADVQLSFPIDTSATVMPGAAVAPVQKITAAVYVKHQGILDDPNSHLVTKIKRLVSGSVVGLDVNDVTVISDRSRFTDVSLTPQIEPLGAKAKEYVSIWSIVMSKNSAGRFRFIFFLLMIITIVCAVLLGWMTWKFYPMLRRRGGLKALFNHIPIQEQEGTTETQRKEDVKK
jgi:type III secretion protein J